MYQFSRAIYRELSSAVAQDRNATVSRAVLLRECESAVERLALDRHYFAKPVRTLFNDVRALFPMSAAVARVQRDSSST